MCFGVGVYLNYKRRKLAEQVALDKRLSREEKLVGPAPQGSAECTICMERIATVVFTPCNHMLACESCTLLLQRSANTECPMCRREIEYEKCFILKKAANAA